MESWENMSGPGAPDLATRLKRQAKILTSQVRVETNVWIISYGSHASTVCMDACRIEPLVRPNLLAIQGKFAAVGPPLERSIAVRDTLLSAKHQCAANYLNELADVFKSQIGAFQAIPCGRISPSYLV